MDDDSEPKSISDPSSPSTSIVAPVKKPINKAALKASQNAWLASEPNWRFRLGDEWHPQKFFTTGMSALGLWTREDIDTLPPNQLTHIVVKQTDLPHEGSGPDEAKCYALLKTVKTEHIIKTYRRVHRDLRQGTKIAGDRGHLVERLYLEYCPGGDLQGFVDELKLLTRPLDEEDIWYIFHCLALSCCVLDRGTEDLERAAWDYEIVNADLNVNNVMFGCYESQDARIPVVKLIDFGWGQIFSKKSPNPRGDRESEFDNGLLVPLPQEADLESYSYDNPLSSATNIFQVGIIMFDIITHGKTENLYGMTNVHLGPCCINDKMQNLSTNERRFLGWELYENPDWEYYSEDLRALILECLICEAIHRPTSVDLQQRTQDGMELWRGVAERSPHEFPMFENLPRKSYTGDPPKSWKIMDDTTIDLMFEAHESIKNVKKPWPWMVFIRDLPLSIPISLLKKQLHTQLRGNKLGSDGNTIICYDIKPEEQILWRWDRELLDAETLGSIGVADWERITWFSKSAVASELEGVKARLRELDESEAYHRRNRGRGYDDVMAPWP